MKKFSKNNLSKAASPYLRQHQDNPIHWQEWSEDVLAYAREENKPLFVSVGYATCHWCHVMAREAFSDKKIAEFLNNHFVSIKVDREQRPDIDDYLMEFAAQTLGSGGWPLNVILSPNQDPFFVGTYFPVKEKRGIPGFLKVLQEVYRLYEQDKEKITPFSFDSATETIFEESEIIETVKQSYDKKWAGFGKGTKFPPHNTLLFLMSYYEETKDAELVSVITNTMNQMMLRGLHDHLQGGFYRYCVDQQWNIPHFEKMLYDQAMHLWTYSWAYKLFGRQEYKDVVEGIITCLTETFSNQDGLFYAAHDADTNHNEGETYIWEFSELEKELDSNELEIFSEVYEINKRGNFEGKNHLIKSGRTRAIKSIEEKLRKIRSKRSQPFVDKKIITSWNALVGVGLTMAARYCKLTEAAKIAKKIYKELEKQHYQSGYLAHSSLDGDLQRVEFLEDVASMLLLVSYLNPGPKEIKKWKKKVQEYFIESKWVANPSANDFHTIPASSFDHPYPAARSLAEFALFRSGKLLNEEEQEQLQYGALFENDFYNLLVFLQKGNLHEIHSPDKVEWTDLPLNSILVKDKQFQDCYKFQCRQFNDKKDLLASLNT